MSMELNMERTLREIKSSDALATDDNLQSPEISANPESSVRRKVILQKFLCTM
jgi:hypothetical protein